MASNRTKAVDISDSVRKQVYERDSFDGALCCILCGSPRMLSIAHFISRSQSGLGIVENLVTLCLGCHSKFDHGYTHERISFRRQIEEYLKYKHKHWNEEMLVYRRE